MISTHRLNLCIKLILTAGGPFTLSVSSGGVSRTSSITPDPWALWKSTHFTPVQQTAGLPLDLADPGSDGLPNLAEYALDTNPRQFTPPLRGVMTATGFAITFTRPASLPGIRYFAGSSENLAGWTAVPLDVVTPEAVETVRAFSLFGVAPSTARGALRAAVR